MKRFLILLVACLVYCTNCGGDDGGPIPGRPSGSSPSIFDLQCPETSLNRNQGGGGYTVEGCSLDFIDEDEDMATILQMSLYTAQDCGQAPLADIPIDVRSQTVGQKEGTVVFNARIKTNCVAGTYTYGFVAVDEESNESDTLTLDFVLVEAVVP